MYTHTNIYKCIQTRKPIDSINENGGRTKNPSVNESKTKSLIKNVFYFLQSRLYLDIYICM